MGGSRFTTAAGGTGVGAAGAAWGGGSGAGVGVGAAAAIAWTTGGGSTLAHCLTQTVTQ